MRRNPRREEPVDFDPEPERTLRSRRKALKSNKMGEQIEVMHTELLRQLATLQQAITEQRMEMDEMRRAQQPQQQEPQKRLGDYSLARYEGPTAGVRPPIEANEFELRPQLLHMLTQTQFGGSPNENPHQHLNAFLELMDTFKVSNVSNDALFLRAFSFSLRDKAKAWIMSVPKDSISTWDKLAEAFLNKFFPPKKTAEIRDKINGFRVKEGESLWESWERFKELLNSCPHHGIDKWLLLQNFYLSLDPPNRGLLDNSSQGALMNLPVDTAWEQIEKVALHNHNYGSTRDPIPKKGGIYEVSSETALKAEFEALKLEVKQLRAEKEKQTVASIRCQLCGTTDHDINSCQLTAPAPETQVEDASYVNNFNRG